MQIRQDRKIKGFRKRTYNDVMYSRGQRHVTCVLFTLERHELNFPAKWMYTEKSEKPVIVCIARMWR